MPSRLRPHVLVNCHKCSLIIYPAGLRRVLHRQLWVSWPLIASPGLVAMHAVL